jgi:hypothetical protein
MFSTIIQTYYGVFRLKISPFYDRDRKTVLEYMLLITGKDKEGNKTQCLSVTVPVKTDRAYMSWLEYNESCYIVSYEPNKSLAQHMVHLACTIIKEESPHIKYITLKDMSKIKCDLPSPQKQVTVPLMHFYVAFHGKTWYEDKFGAAIDSDVIRDLYHTLLRNFDDPAHKPDLFRFENEDLAAILQPIYDASSTWREFFSAIAAAYGSDKCAMVYPWLLSALLHIMDGQLVYEGIMWKFDIRGQSIKTVKYKSFVDTGKYGGSRQQRLRRLTRRRARDVEIGNPNISNSLEYASWLRARALQAK